MTSMYVFVLSTLKLTTHKNNVKKMESKHLPAGVMWHPVRYNSRAAAVSGLRKSHTQPSASGLRGVSYQGAGDAPAAGLSHSHKRTVFFFLRNSLVKKTHNKTAYSTPTVSKLFLSFKAIHFNRGEEKCPFEVLKCLAIFVSYWLKSYATLLIWC